MQRLASKLGVSVRTLNNWLNDESLGLRTVLRAHRHGKHWRLDYPPTAKQWRAYVAEIRQAIAPFHRRRDPSRLPYRKRKTSAWVRRFKTLMGWDGSEAAARRERDLLTLHLATWFRTMLPQFGELSPDFHASPPEAKEVWGLRVQEWQTAAAEVVTFARILSHELNKRVLAISRHDLRAYAAREASKADISTDAVSARALRALVELAESHWPERKDIESARRLTAQGRPDMPEFLDALWSLASTARPPTCEALARLLFRDEKHADAVRLRDHVPALPKVPRGISISTFRRRFGHPEGSAKRFVEDHWRNLTGFGTIPVPPQAHRKRTIHRDE